MGRRVERTKEDKRREDQLLQASFVSCRGKGKREKKEIVVEFSRYISQSSVTKTDLTCTITAISYSNAVVFIRFLLYPDSPLVAWLACIQSAASLGNWEPSWPFFHSTRTAPALVDSISASPTRYQVRPAYVSPDESRPVLNRLRKTLRDSSFI